MPKLSVGRFSLDCDQCGAKIWFHRKQGSPEEVTCHVCGKNHSRKLDPKDVRLKEKEVQPHESMRIRSHANSPEGPKGMIFKSASENSGVPPRERNSMRFSQGSQTHKPIFRPRTPIVEEEPQNEAERGQDEEDRGRGRGNQ